MVQPINYSIPAPTPFESLTQGMRLGAAMEEVQAARQQRAMQAEQMKAEMEAARQKAEQQRRSQEALSAYFAKPFEQRTSADIESLVPFLPKDQFASLIDIAKTRSQEQNAATARLYGEMATTIRSGSPEVASRLARERSQAETDPQQKRAFDGLAQAIEKAPQQAFDILAIPMAALGGPYIENLKKAYDIAGPKAAAETTEAQAKAQAAQIELRTLEARKQADLAKAQSEAEKSRIEAKYAEQERRANLALTAARTAESRASAIPGDIRTALWYQSASPAQKAAVNEFERVRQKAQPPKYDAQAGGFIIAPTDEKPQGDFIPLRQVSNSRDQAAAVKALRAAGYDPETGEDRVSELIKRSTGGAAQTLAAKSLEFWNITTPGQKAIGELQAAASAITTDMLGGKLGAGISNTDREFILQSLGDVGNSLLGTGRRLQAWTAARNRMITAGMVPPPTKPPKSQPVEQIRSPEEMAPTRGTDIGGGFRVLD